MNQHPYLHPSPGFMIQDLVRGDMTLFDH